MTETVVVQVRERRDTAANWALVNPTLADGETGYDKTAKRRKTGDGVTPWTGLPFDEVGPQGNPGQPGGKGDPAVGTLQLAAFTMPAAIDTNVTITSMTPAPGQPGSIAPGSSPVLGGVTDRKVQISVAANGVITLTTKDAGTGGAILPNTNFTPGFLDAAVSARATALESFKTKTGTLTDRVTSMGSNGAYLSTLNAAGTFSGWAAPVGPRPRLNRVTIRLDPFDAAALPTMVRVRLRAVNSGGASLAVVDVPVVGAVAGVAYYVAVDLPVIIDQGNVPLWLEYAANGKTGFANTGTKGFLQGSQVGIAYATGSSLSATFTNSLASTNNIYAVFELLTTADAIGLTPQFKLALEAAYAKLSDVDKSYGALGVARAILSGGKATGPAGAITNASSIFSGWGVGLGVIAGPWATAIIPIIPWDATRPISMIRVIARSTDYQGGIIQEKTISFSPLPVSTGIVEIPVTFDAPISSAGSVWLEWFCNGHTGYALGTPIAAEPGVPRVRYATGGDINTLVTTASGSPVGIYVRVGNLDPNSSAIDVNGSLLQAALRPALSARINLADVIPAIVGKECAIYFDGLLDSSVLSSQFKWDVICAKGQQQEERWVFTPAAGDAGTITPLTLNLRFEDTIVFSQTSSLQVAAALSGNGVTRKVVIMGDSHIQQGFVPAELVALSAASTTLKIQLLGTRQCEAPNGTIYTEGASGQTLAWQLTDPASSFTPGVTTVADFASYLATNSYTMAAGDWFIVALGTNDIFNQVNYESSLFKGDEFVAQLNAWILNVQAAVPGIRIGVLESPPASSSQDAFGTSYASGVTRHQFMRNRAALERKKKAAFEGRTGSNVYYMPFGCAWDNVNNVQVGALGPVNAYNPAVQVARQSNGVHAAPSGAGQMANAVWCGLVLRG